jgi:hypothetical protein
VEANGSRVKEKEGVTLECGDEDGTAFEFARPSSLPADAIQELTAGIEETYLPATPVRDNNATVGKLSHTAYPMERVP